MIINKIDNISSKKVNIFLCGDSEWHSKSLHLINSISDSAEFDMNLIFLHSENINEAISKKIEHILSYSDFNIDYYDLKVSSVVYKKMNSLKSNNKNVTNSAFLKFEINDYHNKYFNSDVSIYLDSDFIIKKPFFSSLIEDVKEGFNASLDERAIKCFDTPKTPSYYNKNNLISADVNLTEYINSGFFAIKGKVISSKDLYEAKMNWDTHYADQDTFNIAYKVKNILSYKYNFLLSWVMIDPKIDHKILRKRLSSDIFAVHYAGEFKQWNYTTKYPKIIHDINVNNKLSLKNKIIDFNSKTISYEKLNFKNYPQNVKKYERCIFITIDEDYVNKSIISIKSIIKNFNKCDILILHNGIKNNSIKRIKSIDDNIIFIDISSIENFKDFKISTRHGNMISARFFFNKLNYKQVVYLDSDIFITNKKINKIFKYNEKPFYLSKDSFALEYNDNLKNFNENWFKKFTFPDIQYNKYLNSGVILFNNFLINENINFLASFKNWLTYNNESKWPDQDYINFYIQNVSSFGILPGTFNRQPSYMDKKSILFHFTGVNKLNNFDDWCAENRPWSKYKYYHRILYIKKKFPDYGNI